jgi:hypothetical protein
MREFPRRAHAPSCPAVHAPLGKQISWREAAHERGFMVGTRACASSSGGRMRPPGQASMLAWRAAHGQGACGPPPPVAPFRRSFPRRPPAYVLNRTSTGSHAFRIDRKPFPRKRVYPRPLCRGLRQRLGHQHPASGIGLIPIQATEPWRYCSTACDQVAVMLLQEDCFRKIQEGRRKSRRGAKRSREQYADR